MDYLPPPERPGFDEALETLTETPGVRAAVVAAEDGLPIAMRLQSDQDGEMWAAVASSMGRLAQRVLKRLARGSLEVGVFDTDRYRFLVCPLRVGFLLAVCEPQANVGLVTLEMQAAATALETATEAMADGARIAPAE